MKTITMDFDTYKQELADARASTFGTPIELAHKLESALNKLGDGITTRDSFHDARRLIHEVIEKLRGIEID